MELEFLRDENRSLSDEDFSSYNRLEQAIREFGKTGKLVLDQDHTRKLAGMLREHSARVKSEIERLLPLAELGRRVEAMPLGGELRRLSEAAPWHYWPIELTELDAMAGKTALEALQRAGIGD